MRLGRCKADAADSCAVQKNKMSQPMRFGGSKADSADSCEAERRTTLSQSWPLPSTPSEVELTCGSERKGAIGRLAHSRLLPSTPIELTFDAGTCLVGFR